MDKTELAGRMKKYEAQETFPTLMPNLPTCLRLDGRAFHSFTKGLMRPYDMRMSNAMIAVTTGLVKEFNANLGYTQSDEISLMFKSDRIDNDDLIFAGKKFKLISNICSFASVLFYKEVLDKMPEKSHLVPSFDCRMWQMPSLIEAANYFVWRELDATKNSISMLAQSKFSHVQLQNKNGTQMQDMLHDIGINWNDCPDFFKRGTYIKRVRKSMKFDGIEISRLPVNHAAHENPNLEVVRNIVEKYDIPIITKVVNKVPVLFESENVDPILNK